MVNEERDSLVVSLFFGLALADVGLLVVLGALDSRGSRLGMHAGFFYLGFGNVDLCNSLFSHDVSYFFII